MSHKGNTIPYLTENSPFPPPGQANADGLLAIGGDLSPDRLLRAYRQGIFPWFTDDSLILWWSPDPRMVLFPDQLRITKSMRQVIRSGRFQMRCNTRFEDVLEACATVVRKGQPGTWITENMRKAYLALHEMGIAKSYETWEGDRLVGGLYGIDLGGVFCGESMFYRVSNASKYAFIEAVRDLRSKGCRLVDCQVYNAHLKTLGACEISRQAFLRYLQGEDDIRGEE